MSKLAELDNETLNRVKIDANAFDLAMNGDAGLLNLIDMGLVEIKGEKDGELIYGIPEDVKIIGGNKCLSN